MALASTIMRICAGDPTDVRGVGASPLCPHNTYTALPVQGYSSTAVSVVFLYGAIHMHMYTHVYRQYLIFFRMCSRRVVRVVDASLCVIHSSSRLNSVESHLLYHNIYVYILNFQTPIPTFAPAPAPARATCNWVCSTPVRCPTAPIAGVAALAGAAAALPCPPSPKQHCHVLRARRN